MGVLLIGTIIMCIPIIIIGYVADWRERRYDEEAQK